MKLTRAALVAAGMLALACTEHVATEPKIDDQPQATRLAPIAARAAQFEPVGYVIAGERSFGAKATNGTDVTGAEGWDAGEYRYGALSVATDRSAPRSAPTVMQVTYERGHRGGVTLARVTKPLAGNTRQLYASLWLKLSSNWRGHGDLAQVWVAGTPRLTLQIDARGSATPSLLATSSTAAGVRQDVATGAGLTRGQWHRIELVAKTNAPGAADGLLDLWIDGTMAVTTRSLRYVEKAETDVWQQFTLDPSWGTTSDRVSQTMYMWWDHAYVSGSSSTAAPVFAAAALTAPAAAVDNAIFSDGFESGDLSAWQDGVNPSRQQVLNDSTLAHSGTHVLNITYSAGGSGGWLTRFFMPGFDSVYVSYWMRLDPNWAGTTKLLTLRGSRTDSQWSSFGKAGVCPSGSDFFATSVALGSASSPLDLSFSTYYPGMLRNADGSCSGQSQGGATTYSANRRVTSGAWHHIELWVKLNAIGQTDGVQRTWLDGQLVGEWTGLVLRTDNVLELNSLMLDGEAIAPATQQLYIDDVQVLPTMPATQPPAPAPVAAVSVTLNSSTLTAGQSTQAVAKLTDASGNVLDGRSISWSSSNTSVATVDANGLVSAIGQGTATVSATGEGITGTATLTVTLPPVSSVTVTLNSPGLTVGQSTQAVATLRDVNGTALTGRVVAWSSSNTGVANVDAKGLVTSVAAGTATITATSESVSGSAQLTVTAAVPSDNSIFNEGFESGTLAAWQDGVNATKQQVLNDASLAHSGTHVLQMTYPAGQSAGWLTRFFMPGYDSAYVSYWLRLDPNWTGPTTLLTLRGSRTDNQWSSFGKSTSCPTGSDFFATTAMAGSSADPLDASLVTWYPGMPRAADGVTCTGVSQGMGVTTYASSRRISIGSWHHLEFWVKLNTVGQSNAVQVLWLDGQLVAEWTGLTLRTDNVLKLNSLMLDGATASTQTRTLFIDDITVGTTAPAFLPLPAPPPTVALVSVSLNSPSLIAGQSTQAVATVRDGSGNTLTDRTITWSSSNSAVATVDASGMVHAIAVGSATITASADGVTGVATIVVNVPSPAPVASVTVTLNAPTLIVGQSTAAVATLRDAAGNTLTGRVISWASSNTSVATVDANGFVSSVAAGSATISATSEGVTGSATLTVNPPPVASVTVTINPSSLTVGQTAQATVLLKDANGNPLTGRAVTWSSSNLVAATVSATGLVTALAAGTATISATSEGVRGSATVAVALQPVALVSVTLNSSAIHVGQSTQASVVLKDAAGNVLTGRTVMWTSANTSVATVSGSGLVSGVGAGSTAITATSEGQSGTASVSVTLAPVASVSVSLGTGTLSPGQTTQASAVLKDASGNVLTGRTVSWSSANTGVATVSSSGVVTAVAAGSAMISANSGGVSGSAALTVTAPPPPPPGSWPNEPAGFRTMTDVNWSTLTPAIQPAGQWYNGGLGGVQIATDPTAPASPSDVFQINYPSGFNGGVGPVTMQFLGLQDVTNLNGAQLHVPELYVGWWLKVSNPWQGHSTNINKIMFITTGGTQNAIVIEFGGVNQSAYTTAPYAPQIVQEFPAANGGSQMLLDAINHPTPAMTLGAWHRWEVYLKYGANSTGILKLWFDGVLVYSSTSMNYPDDGFDGFKFAPTWGGTGDTKTENDWYQIDHTHASRP